jgi:hypothetical protein
MPEWLADVTELVNIASAHAPIGRGRTIVWVFMHIAGVSVDRIIV